jgi:bifunctional non-homologous end joining protein LigD
MSDEPREHPTSRFVILHHVVGGGEHWDLMLEHGPTLLTWRLAVNPLKGAGEPVPARRIFEHGKAFLAYEGPLSGNQGHVRRVESGTVEFEKLTSRESILRLSGVRVAGRYSLVRQTGEDWLFAAIP